MTSTRSLSLSFRVPPPLHYSGIIYDDEKKKDKLHQKSFVSVFIQPCCIPSSRHSHRFGIGLKLYTVSIKMILATTGNISNASQLYLYSLLHTKPSILFYTLHCVYCICEQNMAWRWCVIRDRKVERVSVAHLAGLSPSLCCMSVQSRHLHPPISTIVLLRSASSLFFFTNRMNNVWHHFRESYSILYLFMLQPYF